MTPNAITPNIANLNRLSSSHNPGLMCGLLVLTDTLALLISVSISVGLKLLLVQEASINPYLKLWPFLLVFLVVYALLGLYSGVALGPPEELRRTTFASSLLFLLLAAITMSSRSAHLLFTWTLFFAICLSIGLIPLFRALLRELFAGEEWWGYPAVIFGSGESTEVVVQAMLRDPGLGLKPLAIVDTGSGEGEVGGVPVFWENDVPALLSRSTGGVYAVIAMPGTPQMHAFSIIERYGALFSRILIIPDLLGACSLLVRPKSVGGMLGLEVSQSVLTLHNRLAKRALDLLLTSLICLVALPLMLAIGLWVKLDSPGPILFGHIRIGQGSRPFRAWKFRSMVENGDEVLERHLAQDVELREEWNLNHKLKDDPRVTSAGRFLRKTSLDELPQLLNILSGEMSLVGPRPIVEAEVPRYGSHYDLYTRVRGGLTGLWQVSGRNNTTYEERVSLDYLYVRNWSVWLDLCILWRTVGTVLLRKGAY